jgi:hypothetical protein
MTGRQKGNDGPEKGRAPVSIAYCTVYVILLQYPYCTTRLGIQHGRVGGSSVVFYRGLMIGVFFAGASIIELTGVENHRPQIQTNEIFFKRYPEFV